MSVASIREPATAELASFDALNRRQLMCQDASILRTMHTNGQVRANCRALRVLVVDGQQDTVNARVELAHRLGHTAFPAFDGFAALRVAVAYRPDVVVLDKGLALLESCQIARHLRFDFPRKDVWIIAVTGRIDDERRNKCADAGIDVLLTETVDPDVFDTLLMLECIRVSRSEADESAALTGECFIPTLARHRQLNSDRQCDESVVLLRRKMMRVNNNRNNCPIKGASQCWFCQESVRNRWS